MRKWGLVGLASLSMVLLWWATRTEPSPKLFAMQAVEFDGELLMLVRKKGDEFSFRVATWRSGRLRMSEPLGPTDMNPAARMRVDGDELIVSLGEHMETRSVAWVAILDAESLETKWLRRFEGSVSGFRQPPLSVTGDTVYAWAGGVIALDRATGGTRWFRPLEAVALAFEFVDDHVRVATVTDTYVFDRRGQEVAAGYFGGCWDGLEVTFVNNEGSLSRKDISLGAETVLGETLPFHPMRCHRIGEDMLVVWIDFEAKCGRTALLEPDGDVKWTSECHDSSTNLTSYSMSSKVRFVPSTVLLQAYELELLDLRSGRWLPTEHKSPWRGEVVELDDCLLAIGFNQALAIDGETGRVLAMRDKHNEFWTLGKKDLWLVNRHRPRSVVRVNPCTLRSVWPPG